MTPRTSPWWLYSFVLLQMTLQTALMIPGLDAGRTMLRVATFGSSIVFLVIVPGRAKPFPLSRLVMLILGIVSLGLLHPALNTTTAGIAQVLMYLAIWGPVFWITRIAISPSVFANLLLMLWVFQSISSAVGVLQVYDPGRFAPDPEFTKRLAGANIEGLMVDLHDGRRIFRPFGLTDSPGGAAASGAFAALVGLLLVGARGTVAPTLGTMSVMVGMFCIYLSHIRSLLVVTAVSVFGLVGVLIARGHIGRVAGILGAAILTTVVAFVWATTVGTGVAERFATLIEKNPGEVYYSNRGVFLEETFEVHLFQYPMGAGLGRYGMVNLYFGSGNNPDSPPLWVEIQPTAWLYDGGIILLLAGYGAVIAAVALATQFALRVRDRSLAAMAAAVAGFNLSILVNTLSYCNYLSQGGMMFWVLNAALYVACTESERP